MILYIGRVSEALDLFFWFDDRPVWAQGRCRISPQRFLAECCKRQLNHGSFVLQYFRLFTFSDLYWVCLSVFSCTVLFVSISQVIGCEDRFRIRNDLYCVEWGVKLYSNQPNLTTPTIGVVIITWRISKFGLRACLWNWLKLYISHFRLFAQSTSVGLCTLDSVNMGCV